MQGSENRRNELSMRLGEGRRHAGWQGQQEASRHPVRKGVRGSYGLAMLVKIRMCVEGARVAIVKSDNEAVVRALNRIDLLAGEREILVGEFGRCVEGLVGLLDRVRGNCGTGRFGLIENDDETVMAALNQIESLVDEVEKRASLV